MWKNELLLYTAGLLGLSERLTGAVEKLALRSVSCVACGQRTPRSREKCFAQCIKEVLQDIASFTVDVPGEEKFRLPCDLVENQRKNPARGLSQPDLDLGAEVKQTGCSVLVTVVWAGCVSIYF